LKDFSLGAEDRYKLQFRLEFYNLFNRHYYNIVGCAGTRATAGDSEFGWISGVAENPRTGQFGVRFEF
jgi:outer membrane receptor protein involved in Fe transport